MSWVSDWPCDVVVVLEFDDEAHFLGFRNKYFSAEAQELLKDTVNYVAKITVVGANPSITLKDG